MVSLDKEKILAEVKKIKEGKEDRSKLKELIGGEELEEIFDEQTISKLQDMLIRTNKVHDLLEEQEGFDILEGLLNKRITGNLGKFYNIKPEYILSLKPEEQAKLAHNFSEGEPVLEELLKKLWSQNIKTNACAGEKDNAYLYVTFSKSDINNISRMEEVSSKEETDVDITTYKDSISITLHGKRPDLYKDLLAEFSKEDKPNQFIKELMDSLAFEREVAEATVRNNSTGKYSEEEVEEIIANTAKELHDQHEEEKIILTDVINRGQGEINRLEEENEALKQKCDKLYETNGRLKNFVVHRIGKIPFLGRRILKLMNAEVKALPKTTDKIDHSERD